MTDARFWSRVDMSSGEESCWPWLGCVDQNGYGMFKVGGRTHRAHRQAVTLCSGVIPDGMHVLHTCDNPPCCNPKHLRVGTQAENNADRDRKGRQVPYRGPRPDAARLTPGKVRRIRQLSRAGYTLRGLGQLFGVSSATIHQVIHRRTWQHVGD